MSCWIVSRKHIAAMVKFAAVIDRHDELIGGKELTEVADMLMRQNVLSYNYRYDHDQQKMPRRFTLGEIERAPELTHIAACKAADCLAYQSNETPDWEETPARKWIDLFRSYAISEHPEYEAAPWGIDK